MTWTHIQCIKVLLSNKGQSTPSNAYKKTGCNELTCNKLHSKNLWSFSAVCKKSFLTMNFAQTSKFWLLVKKSFLWKFDVKKTGVDIFMLSNTTGSSVSRRSIIGSVQGNKNWCTSILYSRKSSVQRGRIIVDVKRNVSLPLVVSLLFLGHQNHNDPAQGKFWNQRDR